ncbi:MAG: Rrf2 family transcriptional regulator [Candidatus Omnitrophota bacterium]
MKMITRDTDYAIRALGCIAQTKERIVTVSHLQKELAMPRSFLRKILQLLTKKGLLRSAKGKGGGFSLDKNADKITIFDVIEIFQGPLKLNKHVFKGKICPAIEACIFKKKLDIIEGNLINEFKAITIKSLLKN